MPHILLGTTIYNTCFAHYFTNQLLLLLLALAQVASTLLRIPSFFLLLHGINIRQAFTLMSIFDLFQLSALFLITSTAKSRRKGNNALLCGDEQWMKTG